MASGISPFTNRLVNVIVCVGAAVVIFGAWAKILHKSFADIMLTVGLLTEAAIFLVYAILPPPDAGGSTVTVPERGNPALKSMEAMLSDADITPVNLSKLSSGFQKLGTTVDKMGEIGDVVKSTGDFSAKTKEAATALSNIATAVTGATASMASFSTASESTKQFHEQVQVMTKNLGSLNTIYEMELQESNNHLKSLNQFYGNLNQVALTMSGTAEDAQNAKEQISDLAKNLGKLNGIYGSMITAMQGNKA